MKWMWTVDGLILKRQDQNLSDILHGDDIMANYRQALFLCWRNDEGMDGEYC